MPVFDPQPIALKGPHVRLEPLALRHAEDLFEASRDPSIWTYLLAKQPETVAGVEEFIQASFRKLEEGTRISFAVVERESGKAVGVTCYFDISRPFRWVEIGGTWYAVRVQRTAVNTECKYLLLRHAFEELGAVRVQLKSDALNQRSRLAIERVGGKFEGKLRNFQIYWNGRVRDTAMFAILDSEWPEVKARLEEMMRRA